MNESLLNKVSELKTQLANHPEVKKLNEIEKVLNDDETVMRLAYKKDVLITKYEDALNHFGDNSKEAQEAQRNLAKAKLELDENELVKKYNEQFKKVRALYDKINKEIFNPFN